MKVIFIILPLFASFSQLRTHFLYNQTFIKDFKGVVDVVQVLSHCCKLQYITIILTFYTELWH